MIEHGGGDGDGLGGDPRPLKLARTLPEMKYSIWDGKPTMYNPNPAAILSMAVPSLYEANTLKRGRWNKKFKLFSKCYIPVGEISLD